MSEISKYENKNPIHQYFLQKFLSHIRYAVEETRAARIIEIGCADGYVIKYLKDHNPSLHFWGIDIDKSALARARQMNPDSHFEHGDALTFSVPEKSFDMVMALELLEHIPDFQKALGNFQKMNANHFLISVPHEPFFRISNFMRGRHWKRLGNHPEHVNTWSKLEFKNVIAPYFNIEKDYSSYPWTILLVTKK